MVRYDIASNEAPVFLPWFPCCFVLTNALGGQVPGREC